MLRVSILVSKDEASLFWDYETTVGESLNCNVSVDRNRSTRYSSSDKAFEAAKNSLKGHIEDYLYEREQEANELLEGEN